jgi:hypothetical protein
MRGFYEGDARAVVKKIDGRFLIVDYEISECSAACTRVSDKLVFLQKENVKDPNDDALPKGRRNYRK